MSDTPRTNAMSQADGSMYLFARTLERELAAKSAECQRLAKYVANVAKAPCFNFPDLPPDNCPCVSCGASKALQETQP